MRLFYAGRFPFQSVQDKQFNAEIGRRFAFLESPFSTPAPRLPAAGFQLPVRATSARLKKNKPGQANFGL
jgi:hypothetical protein